MSRSTEVAAEVLTEARQVQEREIGAEWYTEAEAVGKAGYHRVDGEHHARNRAGIWRRVRLNEVMLLEAKKKRNRFVEQFGPGASQSCCICKSEMVRFMEAGAAGPSEVILSLAHR